MEGKMPTIERSKLFVGLIDIMFGVVIAQSLIFQTSSSGIPSWASNIQQNFIQLVGVLLILAFIFLIGYRVRYKTWARIRARIPGRTKSGANSDTKNIHRLKIYIAGPYTPSNSDIHDAARVAHKNTMEAIKAGIAVIK